MSQNKTYRLYAVQLQRSILLVSIARSMLCHELVPTKAEESITVVTSISILCPPCTVTRVAHATCVFSAP
jgi:hypothetical protein